MEDVTTPLANASFKKLEDLYEKFGKNRELKLKAYEEEKNKAIDEIEEQILVLMQRKEKVVEEYERKVQENSDSLESVTTLQTTYNKLKTVLENTRKRIETTIDSQRKMVDDEIEKLLNFIGASSSNTTSPSSSNTVHNQQTSSTTIGASSSSNTTSPSSSSFSYDELFCIANTTITNQEPPILAGFLPTASTDELVLDETASTDEFLPVSQSYVGEVLIDSLFSSANGFDYDFNEPSCDDDVEETLTNQEEATSNLMINSEHSPLIFNDAIGLILTHHNVDLTVCLQEVRNLLNGLDGYTGEENFTS